MERGMFGILVLAGLCHFTSCLHHRRYHFINKPKTWLEAREYCRETHTDLATVNNVQDLEKLVSLTEPNVIYVFLGLYKTWGWSLSDADDYKEGELAYWNWASGEPIEQYCGSIGETGEWFATNCSNSLNFFCYDGSKTNPSERFILGKDVGNWLTARAYCRERHTDLARVRNQLENEELQRRMKVGRVWIGLTRTSWVWSDGSEPSFTPWRPQSSPLHGSDCSVIRVVSKVLGLKDMDCAKIFPFYCYTVPLRKQLVRLKLTTDDSSVDLTDPAVMGSILKWVERKLSYEGATKDVKLSWRKLGEKEENT